jgi:STE24 endopeptidase
LNEDKATRYHRLKRQASIVSLIWSALLLGGLLATGWSGALRDAALKLIPRAPVIGYVCLLTIVNEIGSLPIAFYSGFFLERRYDLSNERLGTWCVDRLKSLLVGLAIGAGSASLIYWLLRLSPDRWWLTAGFVFALLIIGLTNLAPVVLLPLFYRVRPLGRAVLEKRLLALAGRAGARVLGVYEWGLGDKTKKANAALTGLGSTRRILVSDTMLADYSDDEIEVVLAHELAHYVHGDIWKGIGLESGLILAGFYLGSRALLALAGPAGLHGVGDVAGLPLLMLVAGAVSLVMLPFAHALSRTFERRADRFALDLTRNPAAFISAMRRLAAQNLAEEHPTRIVQWLFYTHPPIRERIAAAELLTWPDRR